MRARQRGAHLGSVLFSEPRRSEELVVSSSGGVKNAVVFIADERLEGWTPRSSRSSAISTAKA
jgi:hypothetical protein